MNVMLSMFSTTFFFPSATSDFDLFAERVAFFSQHDPAVQRCDCHAIHFACCNL